MANRYWVGGAGTWDTTTTTHWSATSGGTGGASVPTAADSVFFDQAGTYTVTMTGALTCLDITVSAGTVTFATGLAPSLVISGSMSLIAGTVWSSTGAITFNATTTGKTITTNGVVINATSGVTFNGVGGYWTLGSALTLGTGVNLNLTAGTFDTSASSYAVMIPGQLFSSNTNVRSLILNNSTVSILVNSSAALALTIGTNLTLNAGTSQINLASSGTGSGISGPTTGLTFYNVAFSFVKSNTAATATITGPNTFNNFSVTANSVAGLVTVAFDSSQIINGTLSTTGTAGNRRVWFASNTYGINRTLAINSAPSLTDADFRGIYVTGTATPISGTRIGNRGENRGITFDAPKTVYWNLAGAQNWSANGWAATSTGTPSTDNFPLPQDTATFTNAGSVTGTITLDTAIAYVPTVDMSGRTSAMTLGTSNATTVYGNWINGSGITFSGTAVLTYAGGTTQTITSAGKTFSGSITIDTYGGTLQLADALNIDVNTLAVTNGTFNTQGYAVTAGSFSSSSSNVRTISLGASTLTLSTTTPIGFNTSTNLTFSAGTSQINMSSTSAATFAGGGMTFYNVAFTGTPAVTHVITGANTFNSLTYTAPASAGLMGCTFAANQTINGTLTCAGSSAVNRIFLQSDTLGTQRTLTVNSLSATDCDFRDIAIAGAAINSSPTRAGDCGGNSGITFPAGKTVYWNLAGAQNWSATGWATSSAGTPAVANFPLAQDTAVFDNAGSVTGTITIDKAWNIGMFDASARTSAMTTQASSAYSVYGDWKFGTGVTTVSQTFILSFLKRGTQTITSNGVSFNFPVTLNAFGGKVQLADALTLGSARTLTLSSGEFDAVTYNVTTGIFTQNAGTLRMGSGTWTLSGTGTVWAGGTILYKGTANIVLSDTSTTTRTFSANSLSYNKLTIGGTTGTSTTYIASGGACQFTEIAATKTVAHTIQFQSTTSVTVGKWSVTGTVGNVVTLAPSTAATVYTLFIAGPATSSIDYLSVSYCSVSTTTAGEFYVGANSTNTAGNTGPIFFTATPTPRTLYWVGGTGNWSATTSWSTSSGGASGAAVPTSLDAVNFNSASNATAYTATVDVIGRCAAFTMAGPASGNVTWAGTNQLSLHGNFSLSATGITRSYTGVLQLSGNASRTFTTNGVSLGSGIIPNGVSSTWTLASALTTSGTITITNGTFDTAGFALTASSFVASTTNIVGLSLGASTVTLSGGQPINFQAAAASTTPTDLTFSAGTSTITASGITSFYGGGKTFYNVTLSTTAAGTSHAFYGINTFNNLTISAPATASLIIPSFYANQTITGTLTASGASAVRRIFLNSDTLGTTRTLTVGTLTADDCDFRDITIAGTAAGTSPTRAGDCKGNTGITFPAAKTVYWNLAAGGNWSATGWAATGGGTPAVTNFPLAQDTAIFQSTGLNSGATVTVDQSWNIGTIDMSARTSNTMTLATGTTGPNISGNWVNGTGTAFTGTSNLFFSGRGSQSITSAGRTFTQAIEVLCPNTNVTLQDAFSSTNAVTVTNGTFNTANFSFTSVSLGGSNTNLRTINIGSSVCTLTGSGTIWNVTTSTNLTVTGTGTISLTSASAKTFAGGGANYSGITLNQGGAGTLSITGNNTFKDITNTYSATGATTINLGATTQTVSKFSASGAVGKVLTVSGTSAASPATLVFSGSGQATASNDYLTISNVRVYSPTTTWYAGANSTNNGSFGWIFTAAAAIVTAATYLGNFFLFF